MCKLASQFDGTVTNVYVKPGQQVSAGEVLATVVRSIEPKYAQVFIQNRDVGRVRETQTVQIKYDAYPYQEWGSYHGVVDKISPRPSEVKGQESTYEVQVKLFENKQVKRIEDGHAKDITLGLQGIAEIKVGKKRLIETIFTPVSKFLSKQED